MTTTASSPAIPTDRPADREVRVVVIGAGLSGVATVEHLRRAGIDDVLVLEKATRVGGTWRENTYPGCGCDVPSALYSFSFAPNPEWRRLFARQPEIQAYVESTVESLGLGSRIRLGTEVLDAAWDDERRRWVVTTDRGVVTAQFLISAAGPITEPTIPDVEGLDAFPGAVFHSGRWDHDVDLTGKRVAVIGTGASAIQFVPEIQGRVASLHLFQRTASWVVPKPDVPVPAAVRGVFRRFPLAQQALRRGVDATLEGATFAMRHPSVARRFEPLATAMIRRQIRDPELRAAVTPDFTLGCKRLLLSNAYYRALAAENVELVPHALAGVEGSSVVAADGTRREVDVVIFGTGFDVSHPPIAARVRGRDGRPLVERWATSPEAYLGTTVHGLPNAFVLLGPNLLVYSSFITLAEAQLRYVCDAIATMDREGLETAEVREDVQRRFNDEVQAALKGTVYDAGGCRSYYLDDDGKDFAAWPWSIRTQRRRLSRFDVASYEVRPRRAGGAGAPSGGPATTSVR